MATRIEVMCINKIDRPNPHERIKSIGGKNADGTAWKLSQQEAITAIQQQMSATFRVETNSGKDPWSCDNVRALNEFADVQARSGELAAARAAIQKSGKSIPQLAQEQIDSVQRAAEEQCFRSGGTLTRFPGGVAICAP